MVWFGGNIGRGRARLQVQIVSLRPSESADTQLALNLSLKKPRHVEETTGKANVICNVILGNRHIVQRMDAVGQFVDKGFCVCDFFKLRFLG